MGGREEVVSWVRDTLASLKQDPLDWEKRQSPRSRCWHTQDSRRHTVSAVLFEASDRRRTEAPLVLSWNDWRGTALCVPSPSSLEPCRSRG